MASMPMYGLALVMSATLVGCAAAAASGPVPATATSGATVDEEATSDLNDHHRHHHQGGVTMFIALSLDSLGLSPEQEAVVTRIQADLFAKMEPARIAAETLLGTLADGIAAGAVDNSKIDAAIAEVARASAEVHGATAESLNELHAALTPAQRAALIDKVLAQWSLHGRASAPGSREGGQSVAKELGLSSDQISILNVNLGSSLTATSGMADSWRVDAHLQRLAEFRSETFDARTLPGGAVANSDAATRGAARMARLYRAVAPVLTPEQRAKLVLLIREHARHRDTTSGTE